MYDEDEDEDYDPEDEGYDLQDIWKKIKSGYTRVASVLFPVAVTALVKTVGAQQGVTPPPEHLALANQIRCYYVIGNMELRKQCVFLGRSNDGRPVSTPETLWVWLWDDGTNLDPALVMIIWTLPNGEYGLEFARLDAFDVNLSVEIKGVHYDDFWRDSEKGYRTMIVQGA